MIKELENKVSLIDLARADYPDRIKKIGSTYRLSPCPVCNKGKEHFNINKQDNYYNSFNGCVVGGSVYKYLQEVRGLSEDDAFEELKNLSGDTGSNNMIKEGQKKSSKPSTDQDTTNLEQLTKFKNYVNSLYTDEIILKDNYFIQRGIKADTIKRFKLFIDKKENRAIIPYIENNTVVSYTGRALNENNKIKYKKATGSSGRLFNIDRLKDDSDIIILTESEFDTIILEQIGFSSIALCGAQNVNRFKELSKDTDKLIISMLDNDIPGQEASKKLGYNSIKLPGNIKDINEWYLKDSEEIKKHIDKHLELLKTPNSVNNYIANKLSLDLKAYKEFKNKKSGFSNLDKITNMYPGLYVIGGLSTLGKTTFVHQLTDQMAELGDHVLFFSLEMSILELVTKSLSRYTAKHTSNPVTATDIRLSNNMNSVRSKSVREAIKGYQGIGKRFNIFEGTAETNVLTIRQDIAKYININKVKPVVVIDYLQIIPGTDKLQGDKQRIDFIVSELKRISRDFNIILIVISSFNRGNYMLPVGFESFKESGGIEYTADVVWGIQLLDIHKDIFNSDAKIKEKREIINKAKKATPRKIELVALKNRNGISNYSCAFDYYPAKDLFKAVDVETYSSDLNNKALRY